MNNHGFRAGDQVLVRSPAEILSTLDGNGTLDGVPFMPEMLDWCGKLFRIQRRVVKTCVIDYPVRRFPANDVVILDGPRCDGGGHGGCKHGCRIFWKEAWLRPVDSGTASLQQSESGIEELRARLRAKSDELHYFCQSTELFKATEAFPRTQRLWTIRIPFNEIRNGDLSVMEFLKLFAIWFWLQLWCAAGGDRELHGTLKQTPSESLGLMPGEVVRVKSRAKILATLDEKSCNRGLGICHEMTRCCGREAEVRYRVDRLIDERTGAMRKLSDTVTLINFRNKETLAEECLCYGQFGDCPRGEIMYWREIWLERVNPSGQKETTA
jgi:hypothetical protein